MIEQKYKNRYYLNGINIYDRWGIIIERGGYEELTRRAQRKEQYSRVWLDRNGTQRYTNSALFNTKSVTLPFTFLCKDKEDYLEKSKSFFDYLMFGGASGYFDLYVSELKMEFKLLYNTVSSVEDKTALYNEESFGSVIITHNIQLDDDFIEIEYGEKDYSAFISTWDTRNVSAGSSDVNTVLLPVNTSSVNYLVNWGDGSPSRPIMFFNINTTPGDNLITFKSLIGVGFDYGDTYNQFIAKSTNVYDKNLLSKNITSRVYIKINTTNITSQSTGVLVTYVDNTSQLFMATGQSNGKEIKSITFYSNNKGEFSIRDFIVSEQDIPYRPAVVDCNNSNVYYKPGVYTITLNHPIFYMRFSNTLDKLKLMEIHQWGNFSMSTTNAFMGCLNLKLDNASGVPTNITNMNGCFATTSFSAIPTLGLWDFRYTSNFNLSFSGNRYFNGIGLSQINIRSLTNASDLMALNTSMSSNTYDNILKSWSNQIVKRNVTINFGSAKYSEQGEKYRNILINKFNWTITDGGKL